MVGAEDIAREAPLDRDVAAFLASGGQAEIARYDRLGVADARRTYRAGCLAAQLPVVEIGDVIDDSFAGRAGSIPVRRYLPAGGGDGDGAQPAILFFHGGGWVVGDLDTHDSLCRHIVSATGLPLVAVDYRRAPEAPYPAAVEDAVDAHAMLLDRAERWRIDPRRIAVMGDSAGGTLASVVALHARDMCLPIPFAQILFYPVTDMLEESGSFQRSVQGPMTAGVLRWARAHYLIDGTAAGDWRVSPLRARSLAGCPPTFITVAGHDPLHDEGMRFAARLYTAGIEVVLRDLPGQIHGYLTRGRFIAEAGLSIHAAADFLRAKLA